MGSVTRAVIGGVDYGPLGLNMLVRGNGLSVSPSGDATVGTARLRLYQEAGGASILNQMYAEIDEYDPDTDRVTWRHFCGFVSRRNTGVLTGTNIKTWEIDLQDTNLLLYALVSDADWAGAIHVAAGDMVSQISSVFAHFFTGLATRAVDATTDVADLIPGSTLDAAVYQGQDALGCLQDIFIRAQAVDDTIRPTAMIIPDPLVPGAIGDGFGPPHLQVFDAAAPLVIAARFSDVPDGTHHAILVAPEFKRMVESAKIVQWQQAIDKTRGLIYTGTDAASIALYGNPFDKDGAWKAKPVEIPKDLTTHAARLAWIDRKVKGKSRPRETLAFATFTPVRPGAAVAVTWALDGLSEQVYVVARVTVNSSIPRRPVYVVQLGARLLRLGDKDTDPVYALPHEGDTTPPGTPGSFALASTTFNWDTGLWDLVFTWTAPPDADLDPDEPYLLEALVNGVRQRIIAAVLTATLSVAPGVVWAAAVSAKDSSDNYSAPSATLTDTADPWPTPSKPTWPAGTAWILENAYDAATNSTRVRVTWDANAGGEHVNRYRVTVMDDPGNSRLFPVDDGTTILTLPNESPNAIRVFKVTAYNEAGRASVISDPVSLITDDAPPAAPVLINPSFEIGQPDTPTLAAAWKLNLTAPCTGERTNAAGATDGKYAMRLTRPSSGGTFELLSTPVGIGDITIPDDTLFVELDYKYHDNLLHPIRIFVVGFDKDGNPTEVASVGTPIPAALDTWTPYSADLTLTDTSTTQIAVDITQPSGSSNLQDAYIDNVRFGRRLTTKNMADGAITNAKLEHGTPVFLAGPTSGRPASPVAGMCYFDTDIKLPIWWDASGGSWINATGATV